MKPKFSGLAWNASHLHVAADAAGVALWSWEVETDLFAMDSRSHELWQVPPGRPVTFMMLSQRIHPQDFDRVGAAFEATRAIPGPYEIDFRIEVDGQIRWISTRGQGGDLGIVEGVKFGIFMDVTGRRRDEEARELLTDEMSHRVKNLFAVTSALAWIAARSTVTSAEMAADLASRLRALSSAHDLVRPGPGPDAGRPARLADLLAVLLAPYDAGGDEGRVSVRGDDVAVGEAGANALALVVYELATNCVKYGALSALGGTLDVSCRRRDPDVVVVWTERGGPAVSRAVDRRGFGTNLITRSLSGQLAGAIAFEWPVEGLVATMRISVDRLAM